MANYDFDFFVIGGGSGGVRAARIAATHGARVANAEEYRYGGTCVIRGCVPKKLLVYASRFADDFDDARGFGWQLTGRAFNWSNLIAAKDKEIARLEAIYQRNLEAAGATVFAERAELVDAHTVHLKTSGKSVTADKILIATGGAPTVAGDAAGLEHVITSNEAFDLKEMPQRVVVYGGGYIAVEFACIFQGLGAETTIIYRGDKVLRGFDEDLRDGLMDALQTRGVNVVLERTIKGITCSGGTRTVELDDGSTLVAEQVMYATGRHPNTEGLGLEAAGVATGKSGEIIVNDDQQTSVANIFAVGDVTDRVALTPVAIREGHAVADTLFGDAPWQVNYDQIPTAVFSTPELGTVGLPEHEARSRFDRIDIYKSQFRPMRATLAGSEDKILIKLIVDAATDRVVGCHMMGPDAAEIIQMAAIALNMGATKADFDRTMALHPSAAEEFVTLRTKE